VLASAPAQVGVPAALGTPARRGFRLRLVPTLPLLGLGLIVLGSLVAGLDPYSPTSVNLAERLRAPLTGSHPLGTDALGRDVLSRILYGTRISLMVAVSSVAISGLVGVGLGVAAGQFGGRFEACVMRITEVVLGFPLVIVAILFAAVYGPSLTSVIVIIGLFQWPQFARMTRAQTLSLKNRQFVEASRALGASAGRIMRSHYLPHLMSSIYILAAALAAGAVLAEAGLSFFGAGVPPPDPSWGSMVSDGRPFVTTGWWVSLFPGLAIFLMVICLNLMGDYLRDRFDPRLRAL
jgi:peptide/nickel transport system permease protein